MQNKVKSFNKTNTGISDIDIVTEVDSRVQEFLLKNIIKTDLINCRLLAEEETLLENKFNKKNNKFLAIDPIDGTKLYAEHKQLYGLIITLYNKKKIYYTYRYYPVINWEHLIFDDKYIINGKFKSNIKFSKDVSKSIVYTCSDDPQKIAPKLYKALTARGYVIKHKNEVARGIGSATMFMAGKVVGYFINNPNVYDGLTIMHLAKVKKYKLYSTVDISKIIIENSYSCHPGYYFVVRDENIQLKKGTNDY